MGPSLHGHLLAGLSWECLVVHRELKRFLSVYVDDVKNVKKSCQNGRFVDQIAKEGRFKRPSVLVRPGLLGMHATNSPDESMDC